MILIAHHHQIQGFLSGHRHQRNYAAQVAHLVHLLQVMNLVHRLVPLLQVMNLVHRLVPLLQVALQTVHPAHPVLIRSLLASQHLLLNVKTIIGYKIQITRYHVLISDLKYQIMIFGLMMEYLALLHLNIFSEHHV